MPATKIDNGILPTSVVGSYSVPEWLERLKTDFYQRRISGQYIDDIHEVAIKAALKDQERAGVDVVSDGELRRDNDVDYFLVRMPGVEIPHIAKTFYYDYYDAYVRHAIPVDDESATLGLVDDLSFTLDYTERPVKSVTIVYAGVTGPARAVHVCYGNRYARPVWEGHYEFLFPTILDANVDQLVLEFARKGYQDLELFKKYPTQSLTLGLGVIDVKNPTPETTELIVSRVHQALKVLPPDRLMINPDCGLRHLPADMARAKLRAMSEGAALVRAEVLGTATPMSSEKESSLAY